jgi:hypothetical protein
MDYVTGLGSRSHVIHAVPFHEIEEPSGAGYGSRYRAVCGKPVTQVAEGQPFVLPKPGFAGANCSQCVRKLA